MFVFDHLNSSLPAIFDDFCKPFKEQHSHNTRGARKYVLNIPKMKTSFYGSRSIKDWNNITDKTTPITILDKLSYYLSTFINYS